MPTVARTTPYPWPFDGDLTGPATALVVVAPRGGDPDGAPVAALARLARAVRAHGGPVIVARTLAVARGRRSNEAVPAGLDPTTGAPVPSGTPVPGEPEGVTADVEVRAGGIDGFHASDLDLVLRLRGIRRLLVAGTGLETGVHSTMRAANDRGYECLLVVDACVALDPALVPACISMVEMSGGIFGAVGWSDDVVAALTPTTDRPQP